MAIIQARTGATRLPQKVLADIAGKPLLGHVIARAKACRGVVEVVVATTQEADDQAVVDIAEKEGVRWFRGSREDVLHRFLCAAKEARAEVVVRLTGDNALIDPVVSSSVLEALLQRRNSCDYASNTLKRTFPLGLDTECLFHDTLARLERLAQSPKAREHVTYALREAPHLFLTYSYEDHENNADLRLTIDEEPDLQLVRTLYEKLGLADVSKSFREAVSYLRDHPELAKRNAHIVQRNL